MVSRPWATSAATVASAVVMIGMGALLSAKLVGGGRKRPCGPPYMIAASARNLRQLQHRPAELFAQERERVGRAIERLGEPIAEAVAGADLDLETDLRARRLALKRCHELIGVRRHHAVVDIGGEQQER